MTDYAPLQLDPASAIDGSDIIVLTQDIDTVPVDNYATISGIGQFIVDEYVGPAATVTVKGIASFLAADFNVTAGEVSIDYANGQKASTTQAGLLTEVAIASEINTGTDAARAVSPDSLAGSVFGERIVQLALNGATALTTSDKARFRVPSSYNGMNLVEVSASCGLDGSSGSPTTNPITISVQNGATNMLSTNITIDTGEYDTSTAATAAVINTSEDDVATGETIWVEVVSTGTGATWVVVTLIFRLP